MGIIILNIAKLYKWEEKIGKFVLKTDRWKQLR